MFLVVVMKRKSQYSVPRGNQDMFESSVTSSENLVVCLAEANCFSEVSNSPFSLQNRSHPRR